MLPGAKVVYDGQTYTLHSTRNTHRTGYHGTTARALEHRLIPADGGPTVFVTEAVEPLPGESAESFAAASGKVRSLAGAGR